MVVLAYDFGLRLKNCRKKAGLSQREVGEHLGISGSAIGKFENNISFPSVERLIGLAYLYNVSIDYLLNIKVSQTVQDREDAARIRLESLEEIRRKLDELQKDIQELEKHYAD